MFIEDLLLRHSRTQPPPQNVPDRDTKTANAGFARTLAGLDRVPRNRGGRGIATGVQRRRCVGPPPILPAARVRRTGLSAVCGRGDDDLIGLDLAWWRASSRDERFKTGVSRLTGGHRRTYIKATN
jgi:hypothetical protein